eukprot:m.105485 g.105485  ORF g.105485 m.105485 type:complete len:344 (-) comp16870_c0_seq3:773-1804(-)
MSAADRAEAYSERDNAASARALASAIALAGNKVDDGVHRHLMHILRRDVIVSIIWYAGHSLFTLSSPVVIYFFLKWFRDTSAADWKGIAYAFALTVLTTLAAACRAASTAVSVRVGIRAKNALSVLAFLKGQQLPLDFKTHSKSNADDSDAFQTENTVAARTGSEDSVISNDTATGGMAIGDMSAVVGKAATAVQTYFEHYAAVVVTPFEILTAILLLYVFVGAAGFGALLVLAVVLFLQAYFGNKLEVMSAVHEKAVVEFTNTLNETYDGMMTIKLSGWTPHFLTQLTALLKRAQVRSVRKRRHPRTPLWCLHRLCARTIVLRSGRLLRSVCCSFYRRQRHA